MPCTVEWNGHIWVKSMWNANQAWAGLAGALGWGLTSLKPFITRLGGWKLVWEWGQGMACEALQETACNSVTLLNFHRTRIIHILKSIKLKGGLTVIKPRSVWSIAAIIQLIDQSAASKTKGYCYMYPLAPNRQWHNLDTDENLTMKVCSIFSC